ncbi:MAG TPA: LacI family DNA-binding transcriptional regulator [Anaerolineae bacterium]|nr:LacI family DNA-binding transcriptional regulator [Anaerolineae bacterium]
MGKVTIRDVASAAGVSRQTVSRVLNDRPDVAKGTRKRVLKVIEELGYRPSSIARSLSQGRSCTLGVVSYGVQYFGPSHTLAGIEHQANEMGYTLHLSLVRQPSESGVQLLHEMLSYHVDGIIWAVSEIGNNRDWAEREICRISVPVVFLDMRPCPNLSVVNIDNRKGGSIATRHLLDQGYQHIGLITGPLDWWSAQQRRTGWQEALEEAGLPIEKDLHVEGTWSAASGERGMRRLLDQHPDIDAVFACNDQMALGALKAAREMGRQVPKDLAVIGFDDAPEAAFFCPPLSTVRQDLSQLGRSSVRELERMIEARQEEEVDIEPKTILLEPELVVRESSVRP